MARADELKQLLERFCSSELGRDVAVTDLFRFSGGASRETWSFTIDDDRRLVLRLDPPGAPAKNRDAEIELLRRAHAGGVPVPEVIWAPDDEVFGSTGYVMEHIDGETIARKILRDDEFERARDAFASDCGRIAARIHAIDPDGVGLETPDRKPTEMVLEAYAALLDSFGEPHPVFELALRWLRTRMPSSARTSIVHGDFRNGNFIVGPDGIRSVLDWELVHIGDPWEDLAWVCTRSWRFGGKAEVGGVGSRAELYAAYEETAGIPVDGEAVHWWEVMSSVKWGVMTIGQAFTHLMGAVPSLELAAIGRRTVETEYDVLELIRNDGRRT
jgi:aminoglycoside phosphotransferase (APT) family kinase protein